MRRLKPVLLCCLFSLIQLSAQDSLQIADLGACRFISGETIENCRIAYRTYGEMNADKSNVILFPTWFTGKTQDLAQFIGPGKMADSSRYFVVTVGALGNGISSSPSNSSTQPGKAFPQFTIEDMVRSQHRLLTERLGVERLFAVMGISMGGMQTFQWLVSYPDFMEKAIPIVGSPRLGAYDLLLWKTELLAIEHALQAYPDPERAESAAMQILARIHELALSTPRQFNRANQPAAVDGLLAKKTAEYMERNDPYDWASQLRAMIGHDITKMFGGSLPKTASAIQADVFVIVAEEDHMVTPQPALEFAQLLKAETLTLESPCGHVAVSCESERIQQAVRDFLEK